MKHLLILLFIGLFTFSIASVGKIESMQGDITVKRGSEVIKALKGLDIELKDTVLTKGSAKVKLSFNDGTIIHLGKDAIFSVSDYYYEENKNPSAKFNILNGAFKAITGKIGKIAPEKFKIKTSTSTIGIRGTVIIGTISPQGDSIGCSKGAISVMTPFGMVVFKAGEFTEVKPGMAPTAPKAFSSEFVENIESDTSLNDENEKEENSEKDKKGEKDKEDKKNSQEDESQDKENEEKSSKDDSKKDKEEGSDKKPTNSDNSSDNNSETTTTNEPSQSQNSSLDASNDSAIEDTGKGIISNIEDSTNILAEAANDTKEPEPEPTEPEPEPTEPEPEPTEPEPEPTEPEPEPTEPEPEPTEPEPEPTEPEPEPTNHITLSTSSSTATEEDSTYATYILSRVSGNDDALTVNISLSADSGTNPIESGDAKLQYFDGTSWVDTTGTATIPQGESEIQVRVFAINDNEVEGTETFEIVISDSTNSLVIDSNTALGSITETDVANVYAATLTGYKMSSLRNIDTVPISQDENFLSTSAISTDVDGDSFLMDSNTFTYSGYDNTANYDPASFETPVGTMPYSFNDTAGNTYTGGYSIYMDNKAEFMVGTADDIFTISDEPHSFKNMFYVGSPSDGSAIDSTKMYIYKDFGELMVVKDESGNVIDSRIETFIGEADVVLNGRLRTIGFMEQPEYEYDFYGAEDFMSMKVNSDGSISGKDIYLHRNIDTDGDGDEDRTLSIGDIVHGQLYGSEFQGAGVTFSDSEYANYGLTTQALKHTDDNIHTVFLHSIKSLGAQAGTVNLSGFMTATIVDPAGTNTLYIKEAGDLSLTINRDNGDIGATFNNSPGYITANFSGTINAHTSNYINDDNFGVMVNSGSNDVKTYVTNSGFMVSRGDSYDSSTNTVSENNDDYSSWGYWTASYKDATNDNPEHVVPMSAWVAGEVTDVSSVTELITKTGTNPTYTGHVIGHVVKDYSFREPILLNNQNNVTLNFDLSSEMVTGNINFQSGDPKDTSTLTNWAESVSSAAADLTPPTFKFNTTNGSGEGKFFGPNAESVGGVFKAEQYIDGSMKNANAVFKAIR